MKIYEKLPYLLAFLSGLFIGIIIPTLIFIIGKYK